MSGGQPNIVVRITSNVREFLTGTEQVERAFTDLSRESDDLSRDVERDTERMERAFRDAGRDIEQSTKRSGKKAADNLGDGAAAGAKDAGKETAAEFASNLGESLASGDIKSIGADTAGGLISGFLSVGGPLGWAAAAIAVPATIAFAKVKAEAEKFREQTQAVFDTLATSLGEMDDAFLAARFESVFREDVEKWSDIGRKLTEAGLSAGTVRDAIVGTKGASEDVRDLYEQQLAIADRLRVEANTLTGAEGERARAALDLAEARADAAAEVLKQNGYLEQGVTVYETYNTLAARGVEGEKERTRQLQQQLATLKLLNAEATKGSPAQARTRAEAESTREELTGYGRRTP